MKYCSEGIVVAYDEKVRHYDVLEELSPRETER
jgi:hypothetical protein